MPQHVSARKRVRRNQRRFLVNRMRINRMRSFIRRVEQAIGERDQEAAKVALKAAEPEIMRAASRGAIHRNTAARKVSRLTAGVAAIT